MTSCSSRCRAIRGRRLQRARRLHTCAAMMRWYWRSPPIMSSAIPRPLLRPAGRGLSRRFRGRIVTFGVQPERAATEYGYISPGDVVSGKVLAVKKFVEKPDPARAAEYIK